MGPLMGWTCPLVSGSLGKVCVHAPWLVAGLSPSLPGPEATLWSGPVGIS